MICKPSKCLIDIILNIPFSKGQSFDSLNSIFQTKQLKKKSIGRKQHRIANKIVLSYDVTWLVKMNIAFFFLSINVSIKITLTL